MTVEYGTPGSWIQLWLEGFCRSRIAPMCVCRFDSYRKRRSAPRRIVQELLKAPTRITGPLRKSVRENAVARRMSSFRFPYSRVRPVSRAMVRASESEMRSDLITSRKVGPVETLAGALRGSMASGIPPSAIITESDDPQTGFQKFSTALGVPRNSAAPIPRTDTAAADTASRTHLRFTHWRTWDTSLVLTGGSAKTSVLGPAAA